MNARLLGVVVVLAGCGGGPSTPAGRANTYAFWKISSSTVQFGACSDDPNFRASLPAIEFNDKSAFVYRFDATGKQATVQMCTSRDQTTCMPGSVVFDANANQLVATTSAKTPITGNTCSISELITYTVTDNGGTGSVDIAHAISLVDDQAACDKIDADLKARSPNGLGVQGCVVTYTLGLKKD